MSKKNKIQDTFLDELRKVPIIQLASEKCGVSRQSVYRWKKEDKEFEKKFEEALDEGEAYINDLSEIQLVNLIKEKHPSSIRFRLSRRHPKYKDKLEVTTRNEIEAMTPERAAEIRRAVRATH
jgi:hypothetical protein